MTTTCLGKPPSAGGRTVTRPPAVAINADSARPRDDKTRREIEPLWNPFELDEDEPEYGDFWDDADERED